VFVILPERSVTLAGMTISDGLADRDSPLPYSMGGGILNGVPPYANLATSLTCPTLSCRDSHREEPGVNRQRQRRALNERPLYKNRTPRITHVLIRAIRGIFVFAD
jgi:hypothetical protein